MAALLSGGQIEARTIEWDDSVNLVHIVIYEYSGVWRAQAKGLWPARPLPTGKAAAARSEKARSG